MSKTTKKTKLNSLRVTDGKLDTSEKEPRDMVDVFQRTNKKLVRKDGTAITTVSEIFGENEGKYRFTDVNEYTAWLDEQNLSDLQAHAVHLGVLPVDARGKLKSKLVQEFKIYYSKFKIPAPEMVAHKKLTPEMKRWLAGEK